MNTIQAILLGVVQGIAEFLPISSSGHLVVMQNLFGIQEIPMLFDVLLHIPTLLAVILVFRKRIAALFRSLFRLVRRNNDDTDKENLQLIKLIIIASIPTALLGLGIKKIMDLFETEAGGGLFQNNPWIVSILFLVTALILIFAKFFSGSQNYKQYGIRGGILSGIAQGLGVLPGISRSGITISTAVMTGLDRNKAGEYSFLISIPAILGASLIEMKDAGALQIAPFTLAIAMLSSFVVGWFSLLLLMKLIKKGRLYFFSFYLIPVGILSLVYFLR